MSPLALSGEQGYGSTHARPQGCMGLGGQRQASVALPPKKGSNTHCTEG
jgi:hypothetical protein